MSGRPSPRPPLSPPLPSYAVTVAHRFAAAAPALGVAAALRAMALATSFAPPPGAPPPSLAASSGPPSGGPPPSVLPLDLAAAADALRMGASAGDLGMGADGVDPADTTASRAGAGVGGATIANGALVAALATVKIDAATTKERVRTTDALIRWVAEAEHFLASLRQPVAPAIEHIASYSY